MALGTIVVCPDSVGNRSFCVDTETCWLPPYDFDVIAEQAEVALAADEAVTDRMRLRASEEVTRHSLAGERRAFLDVLDNLNDLWRQATGSPGSAG